MKYTFTASVRREGEWYVALCREMEIASQGKDEDEALRNLEEAVILHLEPPVATLLPDVRSIEVDIESNVA